MDQQLEGDDNGGPGAVDVNGLRSPLDATTQRTDGSKNMDETSARFGERVIQLWESIEPPIIATDRIEVMDPTRCANSMTAITGYYRRYYSSTVRPIFMIGINPGRFGGGVTGIPFTDPVALRDHCGIESPFEKRRELSSEFIYSFMERLGGPEIFARSFYLTAACPFGLLRDGKNINYYDIPALQRELEPYIVESLWRQIELGADRNDAIVIGTGKNASFLGRLNERHRFFELIHVLEHPRFIMQYRRKRLDEYIEKYVSLCQVLVDGKTDASKEMER